LEGFTRIFHAPAWRQTGIIADCLLGLPQFNFTHLPGGRQGFTQIIYAPAWRQTGINADVILFIGVISDFLSALSA
jgi:hypothetical protein